MKHQEELHMPVPATSPTQSPADLSFAGPTSELPRSWKVGDIRVTNAEFVAAVFSNLPETAFAAICSKHGDPSEGGWPASRADRVLDQLPDQNNNYINCASFRLDADGSFKARKENAAACHFIMLDDVGTKVPSELLGDFEFSWRIETSPGNHQAGIILASPLTDSDLARRLLDAIIDAGLSDPGSTGPLTRWTRLPRGTNGKPQHASTTGNPFQCRLVQWNPDNRYTVNEILKGLNLKLPAVGNRIAKADASDLGLTLTSDASNDVSLHTIQQTRAIDIDGALIKMAPLLARIDPDCGYVDWRNALMVVFHETGGNSAGFELANDWSSKGAKYKGINEIERKWRSFGNPISRPVTIGTLIKMAKAAAPEIATTTQDSNECFEQCETEVINVITHAQSKTTTSVEHGKPRLAINRNLSLIPKETVITNEQKEARKFSLDKAEPLDVKSFPNQPRGGSQSVPCTIPNIQHALTAYEIQVRYNVIRKKLQIILPDHSGTVENADSVALTQIISLAAANGIQSGQIPAVIDAIGDRHQFNPVATWITSRAWDQHDRLPDLYRTLVERTNYPSQLKETIVYRWLLSAVAAAMKHEGFHCRGVLTLQGPQSIGKTSWINALVPDAALREVFIKLDHHLDAGNKDSMLTAIGHWIVEIGELDSSFKRDIARLKGFLTAGHDKVRRPYARGDSEYPRRTVFCASVNDSNFLVDSTGNSRWWTIPVTNINFNHGIDMQQLFAQLAIDFERGERWWLTQDEEKSLDDQNVKYRAVNATYERLIDAIDIDRAGAEKLPAMTAIRVLKCIGIANPTIPQCKDCAGFLREHFGESKRIHGRDTWRVPMKPESCSLIDDDNY